MLELLFLVFEFVRDKFKLWRTTFRRTKLKLRLKNDWRRLVRLKYLFDGSIDEDDVMDGECPRLDRMHCIVLNFFLGKIGG